MSKPSKHRIRRMVASARSRRADAELLRHNGGSTESVAFLKLLAFEVLLKAAHWVRSGPPPTGHDYLRLWSNLGPRHRDRILDAAKEQMGRGPVLTKLCDVLETWRRNFSDIRYEYEKQADLTPEEVHEKGSTWVESDAPLEEADFIFHPEELTALTGALERHLENWLSS
ncbi:HEPN domain-containing protein [Gaopeijia maritima]|uniref:HEPN domain-containing protein n=1 Tax=Gaopeijia maritima TaxID=3119007 RepID=UPI00327A44BC